MGISSLFGHHAVPMSVSIVATSTPAAIILATPTTTSTLPPVLDKVIHSPSKPAPSLAPTPVPIPVVVSSAPAQIYCATGKEDVNGMCQWTALSIAAINLANEQLLKKKQDQAAAAAQNQEQKIATLQDSYNDDVQDEQLIVLKAQCTDALYASTEAKSDSSFGGTASVAAGNKEKALAIAAAQDQANCGALTASAEADLQVVRADEASLKAQISNLENQS